MTGRVAEGETLFIYCDADDAIEKFGKLRLSPDRASEIARAARSMVSRLDSKAVQWSRFEQLVGIA